MNYIDRIAEIKNRFSYFKEIEKGISVFNQPLTISVENVSRAHLQLSSCGLQSDPFHQGRTGTGLDFFRLLSEDQYFKLQNLGLKLGAMQGSTYLCGSSLSNIKFIKSKYL